MESKLTIEQLAKILGISKRTIERELAKPDCNIPYNRIGRRKFFYLSEVIYATKVSPVDKKIVVVKLKNILESDCWYSGGNSCIYSEIEDAINFIEGKEKE